MKETVVEVAHLTLATRHVETTKTFFMEVFGWSAIDRPSNIPMKAAWLQINAKQELHILEVADFEASEFEAEYGRHVALTYPLRQFDELRQRLQAKDVAIIPPKRETENQRFFFREPNGYIFEIVEA